MKFVKITNFTIGVTMQLSNHLSSLCMHVFHVMLIVYMLGLDWIGFGDKLDWIGFKILQTDFYGLVPGWGQNRTEPIQELLLLFFLLQFTNGYFHYKQ